MRIDLIGTVDRLNLVKANDAQCAANTYCFFPGGQNHNALVYLALVFPRQH